MAAGFVELTPCVTESLTPQNTGGKWYLALWIPLLPAVLKVCPRFPNLREDICVRN